MSESHVWLFATPWTVAYQSPLSMGFSRQEYWISLSRKSFQPRDWTQVSHIVGRCFTIWATREVLTSGPPRKEVSSFEYMSKSKIAGSCGKSMFTSIRNCQSVCTILHSYHQWMWVPVASHPHHCLMWLVVFCFFFFCLIGGWILTILKGVQ